MEININFEGFQRALPCVRAIRDDNTAPCKPSAVIEIG